MCARACATVSRHTMHTSAYVRALLPSSAHAYIRSIVSKLDDTCHTFTWALCELWNCLRHKWNAAAFPTPPLVIAIDARRTARHGSWLSRLKGLLPVQEGRLLAHDSLVRESHRQTAMLDVIIVARGDVLPLVRPSRAHSELTHVTRRAEAHAMERFAVESHRQLIHN